MKQPKIKNSNNEWKLNIKLMCSAARLCDPSTLFLHIVRNGRLWWPWTHLFRLLRWHFNAATLEHERLSVMGYLALGEHWREVGLDSLLAFYLEVLFPKEHCKSIKSFLLMDEGRVFKQFNFLSFSRKVWWEIYHLFSPWKRNIFPFNILGTNHFSHIVLSSI